jgi:transposase
MQNRRHTRSYRPPPVLSLALQEELRGLLADARARHDPWTGQEVATWMSERLGRPVSYRLGWSYLVRLKHSPQVPRPQHALADPAEQAAFKKS